MKKYKKALAEYISVLETSAENTRQAEERPRYENHLAFVARMFVAIENESHITLLSDCSYLRFKLLEKYNSSK